MWSDIGEKYGTYVEKPWEVTKRAEIYEPENSPAT